MTTRDIQASEAQTHLLELLDAVERGETVRIIRHGRPIARLVPEPDRRQADIEEAIANIRTLRQCVRRMTTEELLASRHAGHKH